MARTPALAAQRNEPSATLNVVVARQRVLLICERHSEDLGARKDIAK